MSLPHALLTALAEQAGSGSELARRFDRSIGHFWHATHQQIYRELGRLEAAGLVESLPPESGRGRKRVYRIRPAGRRELKRWAGLQADPPPARDALLVRLRAEAVVGPGGLEAELRRHLQLHRQKLSTYLAIEARDFAGIEADRQAALQHVVLAAGIAYERMWIEVCAKALETLDANARSPRLSREP